MKYPEEVQVYIDSLKKYNKNKELEVFDILHMYSKRLGYPNGYSDSRFFKLVGYNSISMEYRNLGRHDGLSFKDICEVDIVRIFADGSTLIRFKEPILLSLTQDVGVYNCNL